VRSGGQLDGRASLEAQRRALAATCTRRGWQLLELVEELRPATPGGER